MEPYVHFEERQTGNKKYGKFKFGVSKSRCVVESKCNQHNMLLIRTATCKTKNLEKEIKCHER